MIDQPDTDNPDLALPQQSPTTSAVPPLTRGWFWLAMSAIIAGSVVVVGYFGRRVFLFSDDYVFLYDARNSPLDLNYLAAAIFSHFSPVSRLVDSVVAAELPAHPWIIFGVLLALAIGLILSVAMLFCSLFGRSWLTLAGTALVGPSLSLLPLVNWWTAGLNIIPALAGLPSCLGAMVMLVKGRSMWWAIVGIFGSLVDELS